MKQGNKNGTQLTRAPQTKKNSKIRTEKPKVETKERIPARGGVRIGEYKASDKWRCKTCKYLNDIEVEECTTCGDPKCQIKSEKKPQKKVEE